MGISMDEKKRSLDLSDAAEPLWVAQVLHFWFEELSPAGWFAKSDDIDAQIRERFLVLHEQLSVTDVAGFFSTREILAAVVVLDQFSRNLFRGSPQAFAADPIARQLAALALEQGFDKFMKNEERVFLYLPFEHSENVEDQQTSVALIAALGNDDWTRYAIAHREIIQRFGRFPHRNAVLNRVSTSDEIEMTKDPAKSFSCDKANGQVQREIQAAVDTSFTTAAVADALALRAISASDTMPTTSFSALTTGTRRILLASIKSQQSFRLVSAVTVWQGELMQSLTCASEELNPAATMRVVISRSVTTPDNFRVAIFSTTGICPQSCSTIMRATSTRLDFGVQHTGASVITLATVMAIFLQIRVRELRTSSR